MHFFYFRTWLSLGLFDTVSHATRGSNCRWFSRILVRWYGILTWLLVTGESSRSYSITVTFVCSHFVRFYSFFYSWHSKLASLWKHCFKSCYIYYQFDVILQHNTYFSFLTFWIQFKQDSITLSIFYARSLFLDGSCFFNVFVIKISISIAIISKRMLIFHDGGYYQTERSSPLTSSANQWTDFYIIGTSVMKKLRKLRLKA